MAKDPDSDTGVFARETARLRAEGVAGSSGRLLDLFDYLTRRGADAVPATQAEIAAEVFGQAEVDVEDATVRVYVHRLRKRLEDYYSDHPPAPGGPVLKIPSAIYALKLVEDQGDGESQGPSAEGALSRHWAVFAALALIPALLAISLLNRTASLKGNEIWQPLVASDRPVLVVLGDYYLIGEIDPLFPEQGRLIRDFRVNSHEDLLRMQEAEPERYRNAEDLGLNYLPFQSSYVLETVAPLLALHARPLDIIPASALTSEMLKTHNIVYIGLISGMGMLEQITFAGSSLAVGESFDEIIDKESGRRWISNEARRLTSPMLYRDYVYIARFTAQGGALVTVIASERVTGLRGIGPTLEAKELPPEMAERAGGRGFEALFQITGQQGADLSNRLILVRARD